MSTPQNDGGPAFPNRAYWEKGMTLRDWYAGQALSGFAARTCMSCSDTLECAKEGWFYAIADAMIAKRNKKQEP